MTESSCVITRRSLNDAFACKGQRDRDKRTPETVAVRRKTMEAKQRYKQVTALSYLAILFASSAIALCIAVAPVMLQEISNMHSCLEKNSAEFMV